MRCGHKITVKLITAWVAALAATFAAHDAQSDSPRQVTPNSNGTGFAAVYGSLPPDQVEFLSTPDAIKSAAASAAPTAVWEILEHGEKVECLDCIPAVAPLLYDANAKTREIAAWWLRRRAFGVFGTGEVYQQTLQTLASDPDPVRRSYAAYALGEFFAAPGVAACVAALGDTDARVRAAAASALGRLNNDGAGALAQAFGDADPSVKLAGLASATKINAFSGVASVAALTMDPSVDVRRNAVEVLDALGAAAAIVPVLAAAQSDSDAGVRAAACHAVGSIAARSPGMMNSADLILALQGLSQNDPDGFVRDQAQIALRRL
jgi:HEAT repeat protein